VEQQAREKLFQKKYKFTPETVKDIEEVHRITPF
jgi:hypothetical protein